MLGQAIADAGIHWLDMNARTASSLTSITLVFLTALLTGVGVFDKLGKYAGAGSFVPITGFANAMVSPRAGIPPRGAGAGTGRQAVFHRRSGTGITASAHPCWWAWSTPCFSDSQIVGRKRHAAQAHRPANH